MDFISHYIIYPISYSLCFMIININIVALSIALLSAIFVVKKSYDKSAKATLILSIVLLLIINASPVPKLMLHNLEKAIPRYDLTRHNFDQNDCFILLGGSFSTIPSQIRSDGIIIHNLAAPRTYDFIALITQNSFKKSKVIFSGTNQEIYNFQRLLKEFSVDSNDKRFKYIPASNTIGHFNKEFTDYIKHNKINNIVISTSAFHMPRSLGLIKHSTKGIPVSIIPYPIDYHTAQNITYSSLVYDTLFERNNYQAFSVAMKEYFALLNNKIKGLSE